MNRDLSFRVWDKINKTFNTFDKVFISNDDELYEVDLFGCNVGTTVIKKIEIKDRFVIQQSTGLKDYDGVPVFEGDLVIIINENEPEFYDDKVMQLKRESPLKLTWIPEELRYFLEDAAGEFFELKSLMGNELRVIGNIFEGVRNDSDI